VVRYPDISDHGLIGDLQTAALVSTEGTVDWFCCPRFDSPSVFASLLDADKGGDFTIAPDRSPRRGAAVFAIRSAGGTDRDRARWAGEDLKS
jgi:GH15 family glucan-1,4-alpha-glucosidase